MGAHENSPVNNAQGAGWAALAVKFSGGWIHVTPRNCLTYTCLN